MVKRVRYMVLMYLSDAETSVVVVHVKQWQNPAQMTIVFLERFESSLPESWHRGEEWQDRRLLVKAFMELRGFGFILKIEGKMLEDFKLERDMIWFIFLKCYKYLSRRELGRMLEAPAPVRDVSRLGCFVAGRSRVVGKFENGHRGYSWQKSVIHWLLGRKVSPPYFCKLRLVLLLPCTGILTKSS